MIKTIILVGLGGAIGSVLRYLSSWFASKYFQGSFPISTLVINILGSLLIGIFIGILAKYYPENHPLKFLLIVGFSTSLNIYQVRHQCCSQDWLPCILALGRYRGGLPNYSFPAIFQLFENLHFFT